MEGPARIIIKKVKKKSHAGHHGGSWKVAYADFVTAMMAFFLLLWLLSMTSPEQKASLAQYFADFNLFKEQSQKFNTSVLDKSSGVLDMGRSTKKEPFRQSPAKKTPAEDIAKKMRDTTNEGIRIQIVDNEGSEIFRTGSDEPTEKARQIIKLVTENIIDKPNRIVIEGHTDSAPYKSVQKSNWELSTSRASAARRELENNGIDPGRIARVVGYADQDPFIKDDPRDLRNRRISIILLQ
jgi:chemotaxis protein MotB